MTPEDEAFKEAHKDCLKKCFGGLFDHLPCVNMPEASGEEGAAIPNLTEAIRQFKRCCGYCNDALEISEKIE